MDVTPSPSTRIADPRSNQRTSPHRRVVDVGEAPSVGVRHRIPACSGVAFTIDRGQILRVIDPGGGQVADLYSVCRDDRREHLSAGRSIHYAATLYLSAGNVLYSNRERPMWTIVRDDVGRHDLVLAPCSSPTFRRLRGDDGSHPSCFDNLARPLSTFGVEADRIGTTFNLFMDVRFEAIAGRMSIVPPQSRAGDAIELRAELDMIVGLTACACEIACRSGPAPIDFEVIEPAAATT